MQYSWSKRPKLISTIPGKSKFQKNGTTRLRGDLVGTWSSYSREEASLFATCKAASSEEDKLKLFSSQKSLLGDQLLLRLHLLAYRARLLARWFTRRGSTSWCTSTPTRERQRLCAQFVSLVYVSSMPRTQLIMLCCRDGMADTRIKNAIC